MQRRFCRPMAFAALGFMTTQSTLSHAQDKGGPLLSPVELQLQDDATDDQLIKLARAAKINVMADATDWPGDAQKANAPTLTMAKKQPLIDWLRDMAYANRLTWQRNAGNTVVLWSEPDIVPLARRVVDEAVAQRPQIEAQAKAALHDKLDPLLVARLDAEPTKWSQALDQHALYNRVLTNSLRRLVQEKHGWDGQAPDFRLQLTDDAIPAELRSQIIFFRRVLQTQPAQTALRAWLNDATWQKARLVVQQSTPSTINGKAQPHTWSLGVAAPINGRDSMQTVSVLTIDGGGGQ